MHFASILPKGIGMLLTTACPAMAHSHDLSASAGAQTARSVHALRRVFSAHPVRSIGTLKIADSSNWSGYAVTGTAFTQAKGSWIVPTVDCSAGGNTSASFWVGIDGWVTRTVEQTGTDSDCDHGKPKYYAWYEFLPKAGMTIKSVPIAPGDRMSAEIDYADPDFTVTTIDETTGAGFTIITQVPHAKRASAEWIAEMNGAHLSPFGIAAFGLDNTGIDGTNAATDAAATSPISAFGNHVWQSVLVNRKGVPLASPSTLSSDGTSFTVTRTAESPR
jgi:hypothetical protein